MTILIVATAIAVLIALVGLFGRSRIAWAVAATGFIVGIPLLYNVGSATVAGLTASSCQPVTGRWPSCGQAACRR